MLIKAYIENKQDLEESKKSERVITGSALNTYNNLCNAKRLLVAEMATRGIHERKQEQEELDFLKELREL